MIRAIFISKDKNGSPRDTRRQFRRFSAAMPFWASIGFVPLIALSAAYGGWWLLLMPVYGWGVFTAMDFLTGPEPGQPRHRNAADETCSGTARSRCSGSRCNSPSSSARCGGSPRPTICTVRRPVADVRRRCHVRRDRHRLQPRIDASETAAGTLAGRSCCWRSVLYSHFRSEHLQVHHRYVGTPRDPVTARLGEGFQAYFWRVLRDCPGSALRAEAAMLARKGVSAWHASNPFWRYAALQGGMLALAFAIAAGGAWPCSHGRR